MGSQGRQMILVHQLCLEGTSCLPAVFAVSTIRSTDSNPLMHAWGHFDAPAEILVILQLVSELKKTTLSRISYASFYIRRITMEQ